MVSFEKVKDVHRWLADCKAFEPKATKSKVGPSGRLFDLEYEVLDNGFLVSESMTMDGVEQGYFYLIAFACSLRFPLSDFMVEVLKAYNIAPL